ncbi:MAG TPA: MOSC N-terminal beta barrel domain-containing protein [Kofleriaceae bacterium]|nr:MOSC N-terminal beta barrel domain-containing protein [Kofleriaceae bacterium]
MHVAQIWRYPVKSMAGEPLARADLTFDGIPGDRVVHVRDARDRVVTSRSRPRLLLHKATLGDDGEPRVDGRAWTEPSVLDDVRAAIGGPARLVRDTLFDVLPLLVITDGALAAFGRDLRRLRPNLVIAGVDGLAERDWPGRELVIGDVRIDIATRRQRCIMTTFDPDTAEQDRDVLLDIHRRFGGELALDCAVLEPGAIAVGDRVELA